jgi:hypothetical protein
MKKKGSLKGREPRVPGEAKREEEKAPQDRCATPQITTYDTINEAVHEYLLKSGLFKTVDSFQVGSF